MRIEPALLQGRSIEKDSGEALFGGRFSFDQAGERLLELLGASVFYDLSSTLWQSTSA